MSVLNNSCSGDQFLENNHVHGDPDPEVEKTTEIIQLKDKSLVINEASQHGHAQHPLTTDQTQSTKGNPDTPAMIGATSSPDVEEFNHDTDSVMIGVVFDESDLDTDTDNTKLQLYSDVDVAVDSSDALLETALLANVKNSPVKVKRKSKLLREPSRLSLEDRIKCIRMCSRYSSYADAQKAWRQTYNTEPPCTKTFSTLDKKFQKTGSVADLTRSGRPKTTRTEAVIARVEEAVTKDPSKSIRALAKDLGINQASVHRIKKEFEDKKNTLKMENRKLKDRLNDALKRIVMLEKRIAHNMTGSGTTEFSSTPILTSSMEPKYETLVITAPDGTETTGLASFAPDSLDGNGGNGLPTIIALNNSNQVLRLPPGQETIHIITLPQSSSHHHQVLSLDDSSSFQLSIPNTTTPDEINKSNSTFLTSAAAPNNHDTYVSFK